MRINFRRDRVDLSVVVIFYNMRREAARTLHSLSKSYQRGTRGLEYEVIAIDNGSTEPLDEADVTGMGKPFRYVYFDARAPSPCAALNYGVAQARGKYVTLCIDGARILSPGILQYSMLASRLHEQAFIYTLGMHLGPRPQPELAQEGYTRLDEDALLASVDWQQDGYALFDISSVALSSGSGYLSRLTESNCVTLPRSVYQEIGGFDERFRGPGGGLTNLDFFNRIHMRNDIQPVLLLGEATFHQFHNGTATNVPPDEHPWEQMAQEYVSIRQEPFQPRYRKPLYFGKIHQRSYHLMAPPRG